MSVESNFRTWEAPWIGNVDELEGRGSVCDGAKEPYERDQERRLISRVLGLPPVTSCEGDVEDGGLSRVSATGGGDR